MKITVDTNVLVRAITGDDKQQSPVAEAELAGADIVALTLPALCELVWVLLRGYRADREAVANAITLLINADNVHVDRPTVEAGLAMLEAGGDFADGVIAYTGRWMGADSFVSFDQQAVRLLADQGEPVRLLS